MSWYIILTIGSVAFCLAGCLNHIYKLIRLGKPKDFSERIGNVGSAVVYSFTGGMSPKKKESAYLHLPTYSAGIIYHTGTFLSLGLFSYFLFDWNFNNKVLLGLSIILLISTLCGAGILIKRIVKRELRSLSNPDDYISNILVTAFQFITSYSLISFTPVYYIFVSALFLYIPVGKLKHVIYFFAARYHLGFFYGNRAVWPPKG